MGAHDAENLANMLAGKLEALPPEAVAEIESYIEFVIRRNRAGADDRALAQAYMQASEQAFTKVWDNPEDEAYEAL